MPSRLRVSWLALAAFAALLNACSSSTSEASCAAVVSYDGQMYFQVVAGPVERGEPLEGVEIPPCNDTGREEDDTGDPVQAYEIEGVVPAIAIYYGDKQKRTVHVAGEYAPGLKGAKPLPVDVARTLGLSPANGD